MKTEEQEEFWYSFDVSLVKGDNIAFTISDIRDDHDDPIDLEGKELICSICEEIGVMTHSYFNAESVIGYEGKISVVSSKIYEGEKMAYVMKIVVNGGARSLFSGKIREAKL